MSIVSHCMVRLIGVPLVLHLEFDRPIDLGLLQSPWGLGQFHIENGEDLDLSVEELDAPLIATRSDSGTG